MMIRAPMRISLFGGGSDLPMYRELTGSGGCVLSCTIDKYVTAKYVRDKPFAAHGDVLPGSGLGGSGAACVALSKLRTATSGYELFQEAWAMEFAANRHAGWQDVAASTWGGLNLFSFGSDLRIEPISIPPGWNERLLLFSTGITRQASEPLAMQAEQMLEYVDDLTKAAESAAWVAWSILQGRTPELGWCLHSAWQDKRRLPGVTTPAIDHAYDAARNAGAAGGKLCGAGGGGYLLFYVEPDAQARVRTALSGLGLTELPFHLTTDGATLI